MKTFVLGALAAFGIVFGASVASAQNTGFYVGAGAAVQGATASDAQWGGTVTAGYRFNRFLAVEGLVDFTAATGTLRGNQALLGVVTAGVPVGQFFPYGLVGVGYGYNGLTTQASDPKALWTAGAGVAYRINDRWELDGRWRRVEAFDGSRSADRFTVGVNFRF